MFSLIGTVVGLALLLPAYAIGGLGSAQTFEGVNFANAVIDSLERKVQYMGFYQRNFDNVNMATL